LEVVRLQYAAVFIGLLIAYTLIYAGFSHFGTPYTVAENASPSSTGG
jgi:hypothetical protein